VPYIPVPEPMDLGAAEGKKVGLVWAGNPDHARDISRSRHLSEFAPLAPIAAARGVTLYALQFGEGAKQSPPDGLTPIDLTPRIVDFLDTARALAALDLLITVDTSIAHLAGALGLPVWIIIDQTPDWRWQLERKDTPWYPTARLFRSDGNYPALFRHLAESLEQFAAG